MKKLQKGVTLIELLMTTVFLIIGSSWIVNIFQLSSCDFEEPYKCEIVHSIGLLGPAAVVTVWIDAGK